MVVGLLDFIVKAAYASLESTMTDILYATLTADSKGR